MQEISSTKFNYKRVELLFERRQSIYVLSTVTAMVFAYNFKDTASQKTILLWLASFIPYMALRYWSTYFFIKRKEDAKKDPFKYEKVAIAISTFGGLIWGVSGVLFLDSTTSASNIAVSMAIYFGIGACSIGSNSVSVKAASAYVIGTFVPLNYSFYHLGPIGPTLIILSFFYLFAQIVISKMINKFICTSLRLRLERESLIKEIEKSSKETQIAQKQALESSKLASIGEMASSMAHEINNPLTIVQGNLHIIERACKSTDLDQEIFKRSYQSISRASKVIKSLKRMAKSSKEVEVPKKVKVHELIEDSTLFMREKLKEKDIEFILELSNDDHEIECLSLQTSQIIMNLVTYTYNLVKNSKGEVSKKWIKVISYTSKTHHHFEVVSSSKTINEVTAQKLFDPQSDHKLDSYSALELSLSQRKAKDSGAELSIDSNRENSCLTLKLPRSI